MQNDQPLSPHLVLWLAPLAGALVTLPTMGVAVYAHLVHDWADEPVIILPIAAFVVLGMEHSVANMFLLPLGLIAGAQGGWGDVIANIAPVTLGNVIGGAGGVALTYWIAYRWAAGASPDLTDE